MRVYPDSEKGFRLEGALRVRLEPSARTGAGRRAKQVAGDRYVTVEQTRSIIRRLRGSIPLAA